MTFTTPRTSAAIGCAVVTALILMSAQPRAQRRGGGGAANTDMPVSTNAIAQNPEPYYGKGVTVSAGVDSVLSKTAFLVDQESAAVGGRGAVPIGKPVLVIAPYLNVTLDPHSYLIMKGQLIKFDPVAIRTAAIGYTIDLPAEMIAKYQGQPVIMATSVLTSTFKEVAKKPIPPQSEADVSMTAAMKTISPTFTALKAAADASKADAVADNAAKLEAALTQAESIWAGLGETKGAQWTHDARANALSIKTAAAAGNLEAVNTSAGALNQICQNCHAAYRERQDDGTYRIKRSSL